MLYQDANLLPVFSFPHFGELPWLRHAVATRNGGVSAGPWESLNLGISSGDAIEDVQENRRRLLAALGLQPEQLATAGQVHGTHIAEACDGGRLMPATDGLITSQSGVALLVLIADCP